MEYLSEGVANVLCKLLGITREELQSDYALVAE